MKIAAHELPRSHWLKVAKSNDITANTFNTRVRNGKSLREAATTPLSHGRPRKPKKAPAAAQPRQPSIRQRAREAGHKPDTVHKRLLYGWPLEKALATPVMSSTESARRGGKARAAQKAAQKANQKRAQKENRS